MKWGQAHRSKGQEHGCSRVVSVVAAMMLCLQTFGCTDNASGQADTVTPDASPIDAAPEVPRAACNTPVGGSIPMSNISNIEIEPDYDAHLAALDLTSLPAELSLESLNKLERALIGYMLEIAPTALGDTLKRDLVGDMGPMGQAVLGAFAKAASEGHEGLSLPFLRRGFHRYYPCVRAFPMTLDGFRLVYGDFEIASAFDVDSTVKGTTRRLWNLEEDGVYAAQTLEDGVVRETEIVVSGTRHDGMLDFLVYGPQGDLMDRSAFVAASGDNVTGASPYTCMACHFEPGTMAYTVIFPNM
jgi:hypothetical protein